MTPEEVVDAFYAGVFTGDHEAALSHCAADAVYHPLLAVGQSVPDWQWGDPPLPLRTYVTEILPEFAASERAGQDYALTSIERDTIDTLVVSRLRTTLGSGVMIFRVEDEKLTNIWVISAAPRGSDPIF
jgi:hypothetical protein